MTDLKDLERRINDLDDRLKMNIYETEKRLVGLESSKPETAIDRLQYVEDLLLLVQVEGEKIKQILASKFSSAGIGSDLEDRLKAIENVVENKQNNESEYSEMDEKTGEILEDIVKRLDKMERFITEEVSQIDKRLIKVEEHISSNKHNENAAEHAKTREPHTRHKTKITAERKNVLQDVHKILKEE